jgi:hypothetical protein
MDVLHVPPIPSLFYLFMANNRNCKHPYCNFLNLQVTCSLLFSQEHNLLLKQVTRLHGAFIMCPGEGRSWDNGWVYFCTWGMTLHLHACSTQQGDVTSRWRQQEALKRNEEFSINEHGRNNRSLATWCWEAELLTGVSEIKMTLTVNISESWHKYERVLTRNTQTDTLHMKNK